MRIEDTDLERSDKKFEKDIMENLKWLGLDWDEGPVAAATGQRSKIKGQMYVGDCGPYRQSERLETYKKYINRLLDQKLAYYCFCTPEELEEQRQAMLVQGLAPKYSGKCSALSAIITKKNLAVQKSHIIRFRVPQTTVTFKDIIRGPISFDASLIGDIAIAKDPEIPLYNFAVVVDDYEMEISHVIRGEDHVANTPKQILLQKALEFPQPEYAHLPLILDPDRHKMSKRYSAVSVAEYRNQGYLPEAMINFMALLGWHPGPVTPKGFEREIFSLQELIQEFNLERVQKAGAVFNIEKLNWINAQYIKKLSDKELAKMLNFKNLKVIALAKDRMKNLSDFHELADWAIKLPDYSADLLIWKQTSKEVIKENLRRALEILESGERNDLMKLAEERGRGEVLWPVRAALSGKDASPGPLEMIEALGKKEAIKRLKIAIKKLES